MKRTLFLLLAFITLSGTFAINAKISKSFLTAQDILKPEKVEETSVCLLKSPQDIIKLMKSMGASTAQTIWEFQEYEDTDENGNDIFNVFDATRMAFLLPDYDVTFTYYQDPDDKYSDWEGMVIEFRTEEALNKFIESALKMGFYKMDDDENDEYAYGWPGVGYYIKFLDDLTITFILNVG